MVSVRRSNGPPSVRRYLRQSPFSFPGQYASWLDPLPRDVRGLARVVQGLVVHYRSPLLRDVRIPKRRLREVNSRYVDIMLARLLEMDRRPLLEPRPVESRLIGCCRDFATLFVSMARHQGIPARIRVGFANYFAFAPSRYWIDHTIAERWEGPRTGWKLLDPEQDERLVEENHLDFDPGDVPWGRFIAGGQAWRLCRSKVARAADFCVEPGGQPRGWWFVRSRLLLDLAALNREELLLWDSWKATEPSARFKARELYSLDQLASATARTPPSATAVDRFYRTGRWRHPSSVSCYSPVCPPYTETLRAGLPNTAMVPGGRGS